MENIRFSSGALGNLRVLELSDVIGEWCGKLMADMGADVIKIEPPGGDPARFQGPYAGGAPDPERSLYFINHNHNKRSVVLDLTTDQGRAALKHLARTADILIESCPPGHLDNLGLGHEDLARENPALVYASITPYGQTGPYRDFQATALTVQSMTSVTYIHGADHAPPCATSPHPCESTSTLGPRCQTSKCSGSSPEPRNPFT